MEITGAAGWTILKINYSEAVAPSINNFCPNLKIAEPHRVQEHKRPDRNPAPGNNHYSVKNQIKNLLYEPINSRRRAAFPMIVVINRTHVLLSYLLNPGIGVNKLL